MTTFYRRSKVLKDELKKAEAQADTLIDTAQAKGKTLYVVAGVAALIVLAWLLG